MSPERNARRLPLKRRALKVLRNVAGERGKVERTTRSWRNAAKFAMGKPVQRLDMFAWRTGPGPRLGVYAFGGCDVRSVIGAGPALARHHGGTVCVGSAGFAARVNSALVIQSLDPPPADVIAETVERLDLPESYFEPRLFAPEFTVPHQIGFGSFPKRVVVMSIAADIARVLYAHREHGFLIDPGGWWLEADMQSVLNDLDTAKWFGANFRKIGRLSVEDSMRNFETIITELRRRTGAFVVVNNVLTVDPGQIALDYQQSHSPNRVRRRQFCIAITELARKLDFPVLDVDSLAKECGIMAQADFVHYTGEQKRRISREFASLLVEAGIVPASGRDGAPAEPQIELATG